MYYLVKFDFGLQDAFGQQLALLTEGEMEAVKSRVGKQIYLGGCEGKHSEVMGEFEKRDYEIIKTYPDDSPFVLEFLETIGWSFGLDILYAILYRDEE